MKNKFIVVCLAVLTVISIGSVNATVDFPDVPESHWANASVERWAEEKVILGYEDGTYKPENAITRAEFVSLLDRVFRLSKKADLSNFTDVNTNAWYYDSLAKAYNMGIIKGYSDSEMGPDRPITRQEAMTIISRILLTANMEQSSSYNCYSDSNQIAAWARDAVSVLTDRGYVNGYENNTIMPNNNITRAEVAKLLNKTFGCIISKPGTYDLSDVEGDVVIVCDDVVIEKSKFDGYVYIAPSVDEEKVEVKDNNLTYRLIKLNEDGVVEEVNEREESKGGSSSMQVFNVTVTENDGIYVFTGDGAKLTSNSILKIDGVITIDKAYLQTEAEVESAIRSIMAQMEDDKIIATAKKYKGNSTVQAKAVKVLGTESAGEYIESTAVATMIEKTLNALNKDDLLALANVVIE